MAKSANCSAVGVLTWSQRAVGAGSCPTQSTKPLKKEGVKRGGGIRARMKQEDQHPSKMAVIGQSTVMAGAMVLAAVQLSLELTMASVVMIGLVLAPLGTHYSLVLDRLTPSQHRPEMFALLRTANVRGDRHKRHPCVDADLDRPLGRVDYYGNADAVTRLRWGDGTSLTVYKVGGNLATATDKMG